MHPMLRNVLSTRVAPTSFRQGRLLYMRTLVNAHDPGPKRRFVPVASNVPRDDRTGVVDALTHELRRHAATAALPPAANKERVVTSYLADLAALGEFADTTREFVRTVLDAHTSARAQISARERDAARGHQVVEETRRSFARGLYKGAVRKGDSIVTAALVSRSPEDVHKACREDIEQKIAAAALDVFDVLLEGVEKGTFGVAVWQSADACWYVRNERELRLKGHWSNSVYEHWHVCKEIHLMNATTFQGVPGWLDTPPYVDKVVAAIPAPLQPLVSTIVGTMIREREYSWPVADLSYQPHRRTLPQAAPVPDPAIVIGSIVLTGYERPHHGTPFWWVPLRRGWMALDYWQSREHKPA